jgi:hypothetical protein
MARSRAMAMVAVLLFQNILARLTDYRGRGSY